MFNLIEETGKVLVPFYSKTPLTVVKGRGHWIWDNKGKKYLDFTSGISVVNFGHANPRVNGAVIRQIKQISHISNLFYIPGQLELSQLIIGHAFPGMTFFCNSGAEANEAALKMARVIGNLKSPSKNKVLALNGSFHGRTVATISMTGQEKYRKGFEPLLPGVAFVNVNDVKSLAENFDDSVCAIFLEAVQGEGGLVKLSGEFIEEVKRLSQKHDALVVFDEVQAGMGRTGKFFGYQNFDIEPDMITMAKALGNGFPIGAVLAREAVAKKMPAGIHASTFGGNYAACAAGIASLKELDGNLLDKINTLGAQFQNRLNMLKSRYPKAIKENRVYGLMVGIDLYEAFPVKNFIDGLAARGILTLRAGSNVLRLLPPFTIGIKEIDLFCDKLEEVLKEVKG